MSQVFNRLEFRLPRLLALVTVLETAIYRLLVPALRPSADLVIPEWHVGLTYVGLFLFYFASALAVGVIAHQLLELASGRRQDGKLFRWVLVPFGGVFLGLAITSIVTPPSARVTFLLEGAFVAVISLVVIRQSIRPGDRGVRVGLWVLAIPLLVPFVVRYIGGEEALWGGLTSDVEKIGGGLVLLSMLAMPYCLGARPFFVQAARLVPLIAALVVGSCGALLVRHDYVKGMELAQNGFGFSVGLVEPVSSLVALCLLALSALVWTLTNTMTAASHSRRDIGVGIALIVLGGYAFAWPLQYLLGFAGFLTISGVAKRVREEESLLAAYPVPPIVDKEWQRFMNSMLAVLPRDNPDSQGEGTFVTVKGEGELRQTHLAYSRDGLDVALMVERDEGIVVGLDLKCGSGDRRGAPAWSLHSRSASPLGIVHPPPPECAGRSVPWGNSDFASRYLVRDQQGWTEQLLANGMEHEIREYMLGWVAIWPQGTLHFRVLPGQGAPLDRPIPVTALAFQSGNREPDDLVGLLDTLVRLAMRARTIVESS